MHILLFLLIMVILVRSNVCIDAKEYIYPVASVEHQKKIMLIHQISPTHIELLMWDPYTKQAEQGLWSLFDPAGLQMLPDESGFSFIDKGRLRIKLFHKRSAQAIDFFEPLHTITKVTWIDTQTCYFSARQSHYFSIYQLTREGAIECIKTVPGADCLYPQKVDDRLFYIERSTTVENTTYSIMQTTYNAQEESCCCIKVHNAPLIFLSMVSEHEGFVIQHAKTIDEDAGIIQFQYLHLTKEADEWRYTILFSFFLPSCLLLPGNDEQLYESIVPLLPVTIDGTIYFVSCNCENMDLQPYCYTVLTDTINAITLLLDDNYYSFTPHNYFDRYFVGGAVGSQVRYWIDEKMGICVDMPIF